MNGEILIPELTDYPLGKRMLRGLRLIHTHLRGEHLSEDDLTDLAMLRLDLIAALQISPSSPELAIEYASLVPSPDERTPYKVEPALPLGRFSMDFAAFVGSLEDSLEREVTRGREVKGGEERAS